MFSLKKEPFPHDPSPWGVPKSNIQGEGERSSQNTEEDRERLDSDGGGSGDNLIRIVGHAASLQAELN